MSNCEYTSTDVSLFLLHQMTPEAEKSFLNHQEGCSKCQNCLRLLSSVANTVNREQKHIHRIERHQLYLTGIKIAAVFLLCLGISGLFYQSKTSHKHSQKGIAPTIYLHYDTIKPNTDTTKQIITPCTEEK